MHNNQGKVNILVIIIIVLMMMLTAAGVYLFFIHQPPGEQARPLSPLAEHRTEVPARQQQARDRDSGRDFDSGAGFGGGARDFTRDFTLFSLGDVIVNPAGTDNRFFIASISLEHRQADRNLPVELRNKTPLLKDRVIGYFSRLTVEELRNVDNRETYRDDIMRLINSALIEGRVTNVIFEQFVIQ